MNAKFSGGIGNRHPSLAILHTKLERYLSQVNENRTKLEKFRKKLDVFEPTLQKQRDDVCCWNMKSVGGVSNIRHSQTSIHDRLSILTHLFQ